MHVKHILADGTVSNITPANGKQFTLEELQDYVGGPIQKVIVDRETAMWVNEEGRMAPKSHMNLGASLIAGQLIVGDVVFGPRKEIGLK